MATLLPFSLLKPTTLCKATSFQTTPSSLVDSLNDNFGRKGIKFLDLTDTNTATSNDTVSTTPIVELSVRNGSSLKLHIPNAHVSSYRPKVYWKDEDNSFEEVLYTLDKGNKGGVALLLNNVTEPVTFSASRKPAQPVSGGTVTSSVLAGCEWSVTDVDSDSFDAVQVELSCTSGTLEIVYVVSLYLESMASAVIVRNNGKKPVNLTSAILSHFKFSRRSGAGIQGLQGSSYCSQSPLSSPFEVLSPAEAMKADDPGLFSFGSEPSSKPGEWCTQDKPITILKDKFSRVYSAPPSERSKPFSRTTPSKYEVIDQGKELFYRVIRMGYDDIYLSSPGSYSDKYGRDYFICTGPASMLVPATVKPGELWRGAMVIEHDNLT